MNNRRMVLLLVAVPFLAMPVFADKKEGHKRPERDFRAHLRGQNEVPVTLSAARGTLELTANDDDTSVHFVLEYSGLLTPPSASHIHVGQRNVNGGVTVFFCGGPRPACPAEGTVEGDFTATDVIGLATQQLEANNLTKLLAAIRAGETYVNLHTATSPGGEIRGQIHSGKKH